MRENALVVKFRQASVHMALICVFLPACMLCSCASGSFLRPDWPHDTKPFIEQARPASASRRAERFGVKLISRRAYLDTPFSQIDLDLATGKVFERVPLAAGIVCRLYQDEFPQAEEYSVEFHQGTYTFWFDGAYNRIERRVRTDTVRIVYSAYWMGNEGLFLGVGVGGRFGELGIKDTDYHWVPPEQYKDGNALFQIIGQMKAGYDTRMGFYIEGALTMGMDLRFFPCLFGAELSIGFYF